MNTKMYVGNLSFDTTESDLYSVFGPYGAVTEATLVMDRMTGRPRGFAFVTMGTREAMEAAIAAVNGSEVGGRTLVEAVADGDWDAVDAYLGATANAA